MCIAYYSTKNYNLNANSLSNVILVFTPTFCLVYTMWFLVSTQVAFVGHVTSLVQNCQTLKTILKKV
jgi:hypothetical protein